MGLANNFWTYQRENFNSLCKTKWRCVITFCKLLRNSNKNKYTHKNNTFITANDPFHRTVFKQKGQKKLSEKNKHSVLSRYFDSNVFLKLA